MFRWLSFEIVAGRDIRGRKGLAGDKKINIAYVSVTFGGMPLHVCA
jgi:hypothetical protein